VILLLLTIMTSDGSPQQYDDDLCPFHYCPSLKFICAYDGRSFQYFRNRCFMLWHNYCFGTSELIRRFEVLMILLHLELLIIFQNIKRRTT